VKKLPARRVSTFSTLSISPPPPPPHDLLHLPGIVGLVFFNSTSLHASVVVTLVRVQWFLW
jgi:hypothetical protein